MGLAHKKPVLRNLLVSGAVLGAATISGCMPCEDRLAALSSPTATLQGRDLEKRIGDLVDALGEKCERVRRHAAGELKKIGKSSAPALIRMLEEDGRYAYEAAKVLGKIRDERAIHPLIESLGSQGAKEDAVSALCEIGSPAVLPLTDALKRKDVNIRYHAAETLGCIKDVRAVPGLIGMIKRKKETERWMAFDSLNHIAAANPERDWGLETRALLNVLKDNETDYFYNEKEKAEDTLAIIGKQAIEPLVGLLRNSTSLYTRISSLKTLGKLAQKHPDMDWGPFLPSLVGALNEEDDFARGIAEDTIAKVGKHALPIMFDIVRGKIHSKYNSMRVFGKLNDVRTAQALMDAYEDENENVRIAAVIGLGSLGTNQGATGFRSHTTSVDILIRALGDKSHSVKEAAIKSLGKIGAVSAVPGLAKLLFCDLDIYAVEAIKDIAVRHPRHEIFSDVVPNLISKLTRNIHYKQFPLLTMTRVYAAEALGHIGDRRALPELMEMAQNDPEVFPKIAAEEAIRRILK